jgi:lactate dehydrogenase-like 2-hydroxyacid dehydrogenase
MVVGAGYDDIDVESAKKYGIRVTHTPSAVDDATATTTIYLIISAMRQFARAEVACRAGEWKKNLPLARDPERKTLGIVGMGGIGTVVARRMALGWGMKVIYYNRKKLSKEPGDFAVEYKESLDALLEEADVVSLHVPVSPGLTWLIVDERKDQEPHRQGAAGQDEEGECAGQYC